MNKKPGLLYSVCALAVIILMTVFHMNGLGVKESAIQNTKNVADYLFVCPVSNSTWDSISRTLSMGREYLYVAIAFMAIVLLFSWGWALYQNLLKDKFSADAYKTPWEITKISFWAAVICFILVMTPNYFRAKITGRSGNKETKWVLCEQTSTNARAIPLNKIKKTTLY